MRLSTGLALCGTAGIKTGDGSWFSALSENGVLLRRGDFDFDREDASVYFVMASLRSDSLVAIRNNSRSSSSIVSVPDDGDETMI